MYDTIEEAMMGLQEMEQTVLEDMGRDAVEAGWYDIVHACADLCPDPKVRAELLRRQGLDEDRRR